MRNLMSKEGGPNAATDRQLIRDARRMKATALLVAAALTGAEPIVVSHATLPMLNKMNKKSLTAPDLHRMLTDAIAATKKYRGIAP